MIFQQIKVETTVIPHFVCNFDCKIHFWYQFCDLESSLKTEGQFQGQKVNFKVK